MHLIQPFLIFLIVFCALFYEKRMRSKARDRFVVIGLAGIGTILVASPNLSALAADLVGVGRGVDLVIYVSLIGIGFFLMLIFSKLRALEAQITAIARETAIWRAEIENR
jgi:hypothetical protein